jgi:hypothetical protein
VFETGVFETGVFETGVFETGVFETGVFETGVLEEIGLYHSSRHSFAVQTASKPPQHRCGAVEPRYRDAAPRSR